MRRPLSLLLLPLLLTAAGCSASEPSVQPLPVAAAVSAAVDLAPTGPPVVAGRVEQGPGPFDDRFTLAGLALTDGVVRGELTVTSDVSEVIVLEVHAQFFDRSGAVLGTVTQVVRPGETPAGQLPDEHVAVQVPADPAHRELAVAARVWVPVLVNE